MRGLTAAETRGPTSHWRHQETWYDRAKRLKPARGQQSTQAVSVAEAVSLFKENPCRELAKSYEAREGRWMAALVRLHVNLTL